MKIHDVVQGTTQWRKLRLGIPTASQFHRIITPKGQASKSQDMYMFELLAERITGQPADPFSSQWMLRGSELEAEAIAYYQFQTGREVVPVGFVTNDACTIGASPDSFVGDVGRLEIKVPKPAVHIGYLLEFGAAYEEHRTQVQGQLWISEGDWTDLLSYNPALPPVIHRIERDVNYIKAMDEIVTKFSARLEECAARLSSDGIVTVSGASFGEDGSLNVNGAPQAPDLTEILKESLRAVSGE